MLDNFDDYADPVAPATAPAADPGVGYGEDIAKGVAGGLGRGVAGTIGGGGTIGNLVHAGLSKVGVPENYIQTGSSVLSHVPYLKAFTGPDSGQVQQTIEDYTGPFYQPKTIPGQYASTAAEFAPAALLPSGSGGSLLRTVGGKIFNTVVPAAASETAGQLTKGTAAEPYARGVAALAAGPAASKIITPAAPASAVRQAQVGLLEREGIPVTAGQRTGSKSLQWMEANAADMPGSAGRAAEITADQSSAFNRAVTSKLFDPAELKARGVPAGVNLPDPRAYNAGKESLSDTYARLSQANQLRSDPRLMRDLSDAQTKYEGLALPSQKSKDVEAVRNSLVDTLLQGQGRMPGDVYQAKRSQLGTVAKGLQGDPYKSAAFREMRTALDEAMQRGLSPADAMAWRLNNQRYANMKQLTPAIAKAGENLSPQAIAQTSRVGRAGQYAAQASDLDRLSKAASEVIKPMPNSGTPQRLAMQKLFNIPQLVTAGTGAGVGSLLGPVGAAVGAAAPFVVPRLAMSKLGQAYLGNQLMPQNMRDILTQELVQQGISQPSGIARNQAEQTAYEKKHQEDLRKAGLR